MTENMVKFLGSSIVTNIVTNAGSMLVAYADSAIISFIPIIGQVATVVINCALGYIIIYAAVVIYFMFDSKLMQPDGILKVAEDDDTKHIIQDIIKKNNIEDIIKEGRNSYKKAKADGSAKLHYW